MKSLVSLDNFWFNRKLTVDLLKSLTAKDLLWTPGEAIGPLWKQFRHMGRVQDNYIRAIKIKKVQFDHGLELYPYDEGANKLALQRYLKMLDKKLEEEISKASKNLGIDWFGKKIDLEHHIMCLSDHEVLHHGQWLAMFKLAGRKLPKSWAVWEG